MEWLINKLVAAEGCRWFAIGVCALRLLLPVQSALAQPQCPFSTAFNPAWLGELARIKGVTLRYFMIRGDTPEQLRKELDQKGPADNYGKRRDAYTHWYVSWNWPGAGSSGKPDFDRVKAGYRITVTLPCWSPDLDVETQSLRKWETFLKAVIEHELAHVKNVAARYQEVESQIREASKANPDLSTKEANLEAEKVLSKIRAWDREFDKLSAEHAESSPKLP